MIVLVMTYDPEYHREYYQANKEKKLAQAKEWERRNPDKVRAMRERQRERRRLSGKDAEVRKRWEADNRDYILWNAARQRAKRDGLPFTITREDVVIPDVCPILGIELEKLERGRMNPASPSLDKIDPSLGYVPGNVWVISWRANRMKCDASPEELLKFCNGMIAAIQGWLKRK